MSPQSPASARRYQSQLLNFLNCQRQRWADRTGIFLRQLKITTLWGSQLALYPVYAVFQAGRQVAIELRAAPSNHASLTITQRGPLLAPARLFYQLMGWIQHSPLARQLNWFDETTLVAPAAPDWFRPHLGQLPSDGLIRLNGVTNFNWPMWSQDAPQGDAQTATQTTPQTNPFGYWLRAAIAYFFGRTLPALPTAAPPPQVADRTPEISAAAPQTELHITGVMPAVVITAAPDRPALPSSQPRRSAHLTWANVFAHDRPTTWIDTIATPIGYVKHPLERVLGWLDQAILWIETHAAHLWQWLGNLKKY
jgi:hypothetical protein